MNERKTMNIPEITKEDITQAVAAKLVEEYADHDDIVNLASRLIREKVEDAFKNQIQSRIHKFLDDTMQELISTKYTPHNLFGEKTGEPTTIKEQLIKAATEFWDQRVDGSGKPTNETWVKLDTRASYLMKQFLGKEFETGIVKNIELITREFKSALLKDSEAKIKQQIDNLIKTK